MNKRYINEFQEGESINTPLLISNVLKGVTASGAPYMSIFFSDKTGIIEGKLWDVKEEQANLIQTGNIMQVNCDVIRYRGNLQVKVHSLQLMDEGSYDLNDFLVSSEISQDELKAQVKASINSFTNPILRDIVVEFMKDYSKDFFLYPAASRIHHDYIGGLAEHVVSMLKLGNHICDLYPIANRDLLLSGIILHDLGKLFELSGTLVTEYTKEGKLLGHISIMQAKISEVAKKMQYEDTEEALLLRHMVLSHHGEYEYGSPVLPMIVEAELLCLIDNMDARMNTLGKALREVEPGEFTSRQFALENRSFYKPVIK